MTPFNLNFIKKTAVIPKEFRLRQADRITQLEKLLKEEFLIGGSSDKKSLSQGLQGMKLSEKIALATSEYNASADLFMPSRTGFIFKEGYIFCIYRNSKYDNRKIQQYNYRVDTGKFPKRPLIHKEQKTEKKVSVR